MKKQLPIAAVAVLIIAVILSYFIPQPNDGLNDKIYFSHSTLKTDPEGSKAFYLLLNKLDFNANIWINPYNKLNNEIKCLIVNSPLYHPSRNNVMELLDWVKEGGTLIWSITAKDELAKLLKVEQLSINYGQVPIKKFPGHKIYKEVDSVTVEGEWRFKSNGSSYKMETLLEDEQGIILFEIPYKNGKIFLSASPFLFSNRTLLLPGNAVFATHIIEYATENQPQENSKSVWFDEYHNGFRADRSLWSVLPIGLKLSLIQIVLAILFIYIRLAKRFGSPYPLPQTPRRSILEYIASTANLYRKALARTTIFRAIYMGFKRRLCHYLGTNMEIPTDQLISLLKSRKSFKEKEFETLLLKCEEHSRDKLTEHELLTLTKELEKWRKELIKHDTPRAI